jgi:phage tail sheath protein FI
MPSALTFPGIYIEEIPSGVRTITGVSTSNTAFVDYFARGPMDTPVRITSYAEFERIFGGLHPKSEASYGIRQFYLNGGSVAFVVRVAAGAPAKAQAVLQGGSPLQDTLVVRASSEGAWANQAVQVAVVQAPNQRFNLFVRQVALEADGSIVMEAGRPKVLLLEDFRNLTMDRASPDYVVDALQDSTLVEVVEADGGLGHPPTGSAGSATGGPIGEPNWHPPIGGVLTGGADGDVPDTSTELLGDRGDRSGLFSLDGIAPDIFNILCLPAAANLDDGNRVAAYAEALSYCIEKRAFLLVDIPRAVNTTTEMVAEFGRLTAGNYAATYFPRLQVSDPLINGRRRSFAASGTMAGVYARIDGARGVWKAPAGTEAVLRNADLDVVLTDGQNGGLNPLGVNVLRSFPIFGNVAWGARTLDGADQKASEWKYIPVRRTALFIEESLFQALKWVVFEPNDEPLWAQIRLNVGAFMNDLFRQGAFQGRTPREAYFVKCDKETTTQNDINRGVVNIVVGFAPLKPAEFVVIRIQQIAGEIQV